MHKKISVIIISYNEENNISFCFESVKWADEVILVDAFSKDKTVEIARVYTDKIFQRSWQGYGKQRNFGLSKAENEWVLFLDADERIPSLLAKEIIDTVNASIAACDGYYIPRKSFYLGRWIAHGEWNPDLKLRLVKKEKAVWNHDYVHEDIVLNGSTGTLKNDMYHFTYRNFRHHIKKINLYSALSAKDMFIKGNKVNPGFILFEPAYRFINGYFLKRGFRDGLAGFVIAFMQAADVFLRYIKLCLLKIHHCGIVKA